MTRKMKNYKFLFISLLLTGLSCGYGYTQIKDNILMTEFNTPFGTVPFDKIKTEDYIPAFKNAIEKAKSEIDLITKDNAEATFENTIEALEYSTIWISRLASTFFNINSANTNKDIQDAAQTISPMLTEFANDVRLNEELFKKVKYIYDNSSRSDLTAEQQMLLINTYKDFIRNGANLSAGDKEEFRKLTEELSKLTLEFGNNVLAETNSFELNITSEEDLSGLPADVIETAAQTAKSKDKQGWVFTLQQPSYVPFQKFADNRQLREDLFRAYNSRAYHNNENDNQQIIKRIVEIRLRLAQLLGYKTFAEYVLEERMAKSPAKVDSFLNELLEASVPFAKKEYIEVQEFAKANGADFTIQKWDWSYYSEKLKKQKFDVDDEILKPYFSLENVKEGIFSLANELYGISFKPVNDIPVYHPDVETYEIVDENGNYLAVLYLDFFPRESKRGGAWMTNYLEQYMTNGKDIRPHVSLVFNFTKPTGTTPSLLTYSDVHTFLHEMGHGLHSILSECRYPSLSGTNVYRDFVELPSQIMENWSEENEWLNKVAVHYETGEKIPDELLNKILDSKNFNVGYSFVRQLGFGLDDMAWHTITEPVTASVADFEKAATAASEILPEVEGCNFSTAFRHIFAGGYAAGYYGYKWAEVLDADAFSLFKKNGIFDRETADSFRKNILARGGSEDPMVLYKRFRGSEPSIDALLERSGLVNK
jgi:peptidyl-dipeptidase Dcp